MKLTQHQLKGLAEELVSELEKRGLVKLNISGPAAAAIVEQAVIDDLRVEDRLNEEVKEILKAHEREIEQGRADYKTMFDMVKKKLVRERGLIL